VTPRSRPVTAKLPEEPPADLPQRAPTVTVWPASRMMWQIASTAGSFPTLFGQMRTYGPLPSARFDPHPQPAGEDSGEQVLYASGTLLTALAERFQHGREIRTDDAGVPVAYAWTPTRPLRLIDLTGPAATRLGASHAISSGPKRVTRRWARALRQSWPDLDGLLYCSAMTGEDCVALWAPASDGFPPAPTYARLLGDSSTAGWRDLLRSAAVQLGYDFR
jgi:hypothetical protein